MKTLQFYLILTLILTPFLAYGAAYIKFDGIDGESVDKDHKGWSDLSSFSMRTADNKGWTNLPSFSQGPKRTQSDRDRGSGLATGKRDAASGLATGKRERGSGLATGKRDAASGMATGKRQHRPIRVVKELDKASPMLARAVESGDSIGNVHINLINQYGKTMRMILQNATVNAIETGANTEQVTFGYESIRQIRPRNVTVSTRAKEKANKTK